ALAQETSQSPFPFHPNQVVVAQSDRTLVFDPAGPIPERRLLHRHRAIAGTHRCFHRSIQRDSTALRLDQEKGLPAAVQEPPYHSTLIPGTSARRRHVTVVVLGRIVVVGRLSLQLSQI